uniref:Uncharacterized protein n=1 Tax=Romanomermis culicivorax TaxID=13658 RepID=A0A915KRI0_ROMCU
MEMAITLLSSVVHGQNWIIIRPFAAMRGACPRLHVRAKQLQFTTTAYKILLMQKTWNCDADSNKQNAKQYVNKDNLHKYCKKINNEFSGSITNGGT